MQNIPENIKLIINSTLPLIVVIFLFLVAGPFGISKVTDLQSQIDLAQKNKTVLSQKLSLLQSVSGTVSQDSGTSLSALPDTNPSLIVVSEVKTIGSQDGVLVSGIKGGSEIDDPSGTSHVGISFNVAGERSQIITFLKDIANIAPITLVDKVKITGNNGSNIADVSINSYWSAFPKVLPTLTTPINDLTASEKNTLTKIGSLTQPTFLVIPPTEGAGKANPFGQ